VAERFTLKAKESDSDGLTWVGSFNAMASRCAVLFHHLPQTRAEHLMNIAVNEVRRIEQKYSRYRDDNIIADINSSQGKPVELDHETWQLLEFADYAYQFSDGLFDLSAGVLRRVWKFNGSDALPTEKEIAALRPLIDWRAVKRTEHPNGRKTLQLKPGMELDFGGIGKEYAADRCLITLMQQTDQAKAPMLVNLGGDIATNGALFKAHHWVIGVTNSKPNKPPQHLKLADGALATSGDEHRFLLKGGVRYSHILNPKTGWPVEGAPRSVSVSANSCLEAGLLSTLAMLKGHGAETFLQKQNRQFWVQR
jgi:thiamine biosynthesis lipoprotein